MLPKHFSIFNSLYNFYKSYAMKMPLRIDINSLSMIQMRKLLLEENLTFYTQQRFLKLKITTSNNNYFN